VVKFGRGVFELCEPNAYEWRDKQASKETDRHTHYNTSHPPRGKVIKDTNRGRMARKPVSNRNNIIGDDASLASEAAIGNVGLPTELPFVLSVCVSVPDGLSVGSQSINQFDVMSQYKYEQ